MLVTIDETNLNAISVTGSTQFFQGTQRRTLEFRFSPNDTDFETLNAVFDNPKQITLTDDDGSYVYDNYTLRVSMSLAPAMVTPETDTEPAVYENRYTVVMAQKTYSELEIEALRAMVNTLAAKVLG